ncbi:hypothetical protein RB213_015605, partial [Colletotrichum asianum]
MISGCTSGVITARTNKCMRNLCRVWLRGCSHTQRVGVVQDAGPLSKKTAPKTLNVGKTMIQHGRSAPPFPPTPRSKSPFKKNRCLISIDPCLADGLEGLERGKEKGGRRAYTYSQTEQSPQTSTHSRKN